MNTPTPTPTKKPAWYRRNYCIAPKVQFGLVGVLAGIAIVSSVAICYTAHRAVMDLGLLFNGQYQAPPMRIDTFQYIADNLMTKLIVVVCVMSVIFTLVGIILTHHLVGPVWRLENELKKLIRGEQIAPLRFRKWDAFKGLPEVVNKVVEGYKRN
ncbi:MAG: hypothetical protein SGI74_14050 [Oligoflexia bacterium]|nr:hypothetical protein [Oligoflexia bacterium]